MAPGRFTTSQLQLGVTTAHGVTAEKVRLALPTPADDADGDLRHEVVTKGAPHEPNSHRGASSS